MNNQWEIPTKKQTQTGNKMFYTFITKINEYCQSHLALNARFNYSFALKVHHTAWNWGVLLLYGSVQMLSFFWINFNQKKCFLHSISQFYFFSVQQMYQNRTAVFGKQPFQKNSREIHVRFSRETHVKLTWSSRETHVKFTWNSRENLVKF